MCIIVIMTDVIQKKEKLVMMMLITIIPPLESPHRGGANGGQINVYHRHHSCRCHCFCSY